MAPYFLLEPGDGLLLCGADGLVRHVDRTARLRLGHQAKAWDGLPLADCWPQLSALLIQDHRRIAGGPRDHVVPLPHPTGVELATRVRLFATDSGFGVGLLHRRPQPFRQNDPQASEHTYRFLLESVLDTIQDAVLVTLAEPIAAPGPVIVFVNQSLLDQTGYALHQVLGRSPRLFQGPDTSLEARSLLRQSLQQWKPCTTELLNYRQDGSTCWIELKLAPMADVTGWYTHWVSVQRDVTDRVEPERSWRNG
jgi:PAS domain S-box-containing protein